MKLMIIALVALLLILLGILLIWRYASQYRSMPCPAWLSFLIEVDNPFIPLHRAETIIKNANIQEGMAILDAGCGPGRVTIPAALHVGLRGQVTAMDIQAAMLARVKAKAAKKNIQNIEYHEAGLGENSLSTNTFDRIILVTVIGEIPERTRAMRELYHALKEGGILSVTEMMTDPHFVTRAAVAELASASGFLIKESFGGRFAYTSNFLKPSR